MISDVLRFIAVNGLKLVTVLACIAVAYVILEAMLGTNKLDRRMKSVLAERDRVRQRERMSLSTPAADVSILAFIEQISKRAKLALWLLDASTQQKLLRAGYRDNAARATYLFLRITGMIFAVTAFSIFCILSGNISWLVAMPFAAWFAFRMSIYVLEKKAEARDTAMTAAAPDIVDLLTICVESGMSIESALQRVAEEMHIQSEVAGDELSVTSAELSYVQKRSDAFANLAARTQAKAIQNLCTALIQADSFGTSVGATLRIQSAEARKLRQLDAERRALAIPPKLSIVMVFFFMPVIMIVMLYPSISKMLEMNVGF